MCGSQVRDVVVAGADVYCVYGGSILRGPAAGGGTPEAIGGTDSYPILTMVGDGTKLYFINLHPMPELFQLPLTSNIATRADQLPTPGRYTGLAIDGPTLYQAESHGLRKMDRATFTSSLIVPSIGISGDPVSWNAQLFFTQDDPVAAGLRYVMHCVD
jgi:hypothetical protein